jgi:octopine/nopaline transport system permease protein
MDWALLSAGWGILLLSATATTVAVALTGMSIGLGFGALGAWARLSRNRIARIAGETYTTLMRGIPELLVIYLLFFGGSTSIQAVARIFGYSGRFEINAFFTGALAIGIVSGAYSAEVMRAGYLAIAAGEIEAARAYGMGRWLAFRRVVVPLVARHIVPGMGNVWQLALKETSLISVTGLVEIMRQAAIGAGSTQRPFTFYLAAALLFLALTSVSGSAFHWLERKTRRGVREI